MQTYRMTVGDTLVPLGAALTQRDDSNTRIPVDLTGSTVVFRMVAADGSKAVDDLQAVIDDEVAGKVHYDFQLSEVSTPGTYFAWFIQDIGGERSTFPAGGRQFTIIIITAN